MRAWVIRIANAALFTLCCWLTAGVVTSVAGEVLLPPTTVVTAVAAPPAAVAPSWNERKPILDRNLFGARLAAAPVEVDIVDTDADIEETKLPLKLLGTIAGEDQQVSNAAIEDASTRKHQVVFIGDRLEGHPDVEVIRIERKRVILQNGPKREELALAEDAGKPRAAKRAPARKARRNTAARRPSRRAKPKRSVAADVKKLQQGGVQQSLAKLYQARPVLKYEDDEVVGVTFNNVKDGDMLDKIGLSAGDVITTLNEIPINDRAATGKLLTELSGADAITIQLLDGKTIQLDQSQVAALRAAQ